MKKIIVFLVAAVLLSSTASLAATKAPVAKAVTSSSSNTIMALGAYVGESQLTVLKFVGDTYTAAVGAGYTSSGSNTNAFGVAGLYAFNMSGGNIPTHMGATLSFTSGQTAGVSSSVIGIGMIWGAETFLSNRLIVGFDVVPVKFTSTSSGGSGTTNISIGTAAVYAAITL